MEVNKQIRNLPTILLVLIIGIGGGIIINTQLRVFNTSKSVDEEVQKFEETLDIIKKEYVDDVDIKTLTDDAISHILLKLDPHSVYISQESRQIANEDLVGSFEGVGIEFNIFSDTLVVITPLSDGPAEKAGIWAGDRIIGVDGKNIAGTGLQNSDVVKMLKGPKGTKVTVQVVRKNVQKPIAFTILRGKIPQTSVNAAYMIDKEIGYIKVGQFSQNTYEEFDRALKKLQEQDMHKLILDLQGNPGGYMSQAVALVDEFLPIGSKIVYTKGKNKKYDSDILSTSKGRFKQGDLIVLINEGSSSASEIVAGALQENDRALIVGRRSYGKGLVQSPFILNDGSELRLTISRYYTPSGRSIQKPYTNHKNYITDVAQRYEHGEFFHADSIKFNDSLKYITNSGRTVYGGGGIMPDHFVPLDTTLNNASITELLSSNSIQEYIFKFAMDHKLELKKMGMDNFRTNFKISSTMIAGLLDIAKQNSVDIAQTNIRSIRPALDVLLKANLARRIWKNEGFYPLFNQTNEVLQQAIKLLNEEAEPGDMQHLSQ